MKTYAFHLSRAGQPEPDVLSIVVSGERRARELAAEILRRSPDHLAIAAWTDGEPAFRIAGTDADLPRSPNLGC
ncbi:MAG: hypothetical protein K0R83_1569 [Caulobacter sp.]|jgi:hypothetical protein|nr:hypothetical protein [Caulobacter sp.]